MVPYSVFKLRDAVSISLAEGIAQDLPAKTSSSMSRGLTFWQEQLCLPPGTENLWGCAMPRAGIHEGQCQLPWTWVWILEWWCLAKQSIRFPTFGLIFQLIASVMGWNSLFWKWEGARFPEALKRCPHVPSWFVHLFHLLLNSVGTNTS